MRVTMEAGKPASRWSSSCAKALERGFQRLDGSELIADVLAGAIFKDGVKKHAAWWPSSTTFGERPWIHVPPSTPIGLIGQAVP